VRGGTVDTYVSGESKNVSIRAEISRFRPEEETVSIRAETSRFRPEEEKRFDSCRN
jgi:hypothetical protein